MTQAWGPAREHRRLETVPSQRAHQEVEETAPRALQGRVPRAEQVTVPAQHSPEAEALYRQLAELEKDFNPRAKLHV